MVAMLKIDALVAGYGNIEALHGISMEVNAGEVVAVLGANGAGKTTLLRAISGMIKPKSGSVIIDGVNVAGQRSHNVLKKGIAHVAEGREIFARLTVEDNLRLGAFIHQKGKLTGETLDMVLELFPRLAERRTQVAGTLSGGEQQMLAIGRALLSKPKIMLLDEPSMGLAPIIVGTIFDTLAKIVAETSLTVLVVEQNAQAALDLASRGYLLESGLVIQSGDSKSLNTSAIEAAYLGAGNH
jgi:branched-chain amino acid transport system ATP-binding protein